MLLRRRGGIRSVKLRWECGGFLVLLLAGQSLHFRIVWSNEEEQNDLE